MGLAEAYLTGWGISGFQSRYVSDGKLSTTESFSKITETGWQHFIGSRPSRWRGQKRPLALDIIRAFDDCGQKNSATYGRKAAGNQWNALSQVVRGTCVEETRQSRQFRNSLGIGARQRCLRSAFDKSVQRCHCPMIAWFCNWWPWEVGETQEDTNRRASWFHNALLTVSKPRYLRGCQVHMGTYHYANSGCWCRPCRNCVSRLGLASSGRPAFTGRGRHFPAQNAKYARDFGTA